MMLIAENNHVLYCILYYYKQNHAVCIKPKMNLRISLLGANSAFFHKSFLTLKLPLT